MNHNSTFKDMIHITFANIINLASSILNGFVIPIVLGSLNYGYYKIFALYASYETLTHFGFNDGMMLSFSGKNYNQLNKYNCRTNTAFFTWFQIILSLLIASIAFFVSNPFYKALCLLLGFNNLTTNILCYYQKIAQSMLRFDQYSIISVIQNSLLIISVLFVFVYCKINDLHDFNYIYYILITIFIQVVLDAWYIYRYRDITFGIHNRISSGLKRFKNYFINGAFITFGWGITLVIFNLDSQFVVKFFSVRTYGIYAFAYSIFSAGLIILQAASPVLLPHLKRHSTSYILKRYSSNLSCIILVVAFCMLGYFPLKWILYNFIFKYYGSLVYFRLLLPGMIITCCMNIIISSYYYAVNKMKFYFNLSLVVLAISFIIDSCAYMLFHSTTSLAISSTISLFIWFILSNYFVVKWYHVNWIKNLIYLILITIVFLFISNMSNWIFGAVIYLIVYGIISLLLFKNTLIKIFTRLTNYMVNLI